MNRDHAARVYFEQLKRAVPIEAVLARYGIELKRQGGSLKGCCPIHKGSNPGQFVVSNGLWRCFSPECNRGGGVIELVAAMENVDARDAALIIARWFAISSGPPNNQHPQRRRNTMSGERPSHKAFVVEDREEGSEEKPFWTRVGSAWPHKDGKGLNIQIASGVAVSGRVVLREYTDEDAKQEEQQKASAKRKK
jgi:CHC2 zinc finger